MTVATGHARYAIEEYVRLEEYSNVKHEYLGGQIYAMGGGTPKHAALAMRIGASLTLQLRDKPCNVYSSDARVRVAVTGLSTYPDVTVVCGQERVDQEDRLALINPVVLVEVLSDNTEDYDRGEKLVHYKQIPDLQEVLLVAQHQPRLEIWRREATDQWIHHVVQAKTARLQSIACTLELAELYRDPFAK